MNGVVILPVDDSLAAHRPLPVARTLARAMGASLHILHVGAPTGAADLARRLHLEAHQLRGVVLDEVRGDPVRSITQAAEEQSGVIVMCTRTSEAECSAGLGPVSEGVLRQTRRPVVLVPTALALTDWQLRTVLLPHDGTPGTSAAIGPAAELARRAGARLLVVHVAATHGERPREPGSLPTPRYIDQEQHEWPAWAEELIERLTNVGSLDTSRLRLALTHGEPVEEILRVASHSHPDIIVLAWHGGLTAPHAHILKGVLERAPCPVMVVRSAQPDETR